MVIIVSAAQCRPSPNHSLQGKERGLLDGRWLTKLQLEVWAHRITRGLYTAIVPPQTTKPGKGAI